MRSGGAILLVFIPRPTPHVGHTLARRRCPSEGGPGTPRPLEDRHHARHVLARRADHAARGGEKAGRAYAAIAKVCEVTASSVAFGQRTPRTRFLAVACSALRRCVGRKQHGANRLRAQDTPSCVSVKRFVRSETNKLGDVVAASIKHR